MLDPAGTRTQLAGVLARIGAPGPRTHRLAAGGQTDRTLVRCLLLRAAERARRLTAASRATDLLGLGRRHKAAAGTEWDCRRRRVGVRGDSGPGEGRGSCSGVGRHLRTRQRPAAGGNRPGACAGQVVAGSRAVEEEKRKVEAGRALVFAEVGIAVEGT